MKISGTSLIPAARPTPAPFHFRSSLWHRSQAISAISSSSIWPTCTERSTGSSPQRDRGDGEHRRGPVPAPPAELPERHPDGEHHRGQAGHRHQPLQHRPGQQRAGREPERGERRVEVLDARQEMPGVQGVRGMPDDQARVVVDVEVKPAQGELDRVGRHVGRVRGERQRERRGGPGERSPARRSLRPARRPARRLASRAALGRPARPDSGRAIAILPPGQICRHHGGLRAASPARGRTPGTQDRGIGRPLAADLRR